MLQGQSSLQAVFSVQETDFHLLTALYENGQTNNLVRFWYTIES